MAEQSSSIVAVYPDHASAEEAVQILEQSGFDLKHISIMGRDFQVSEKPIGFVTTGDVAGAGATAGAWAGGIFGLLMGAAFPDPAGGRPGDHRRPAPRPRAPGRPRGGASWPAPRSAGSRSGLIGLGVSKEARGRKYETEVKAGKFVVTLRGTPEEVARAQELLRGGKAETAEVYHPVAV